MWREEVNRFTWAATFVYKIQEIWIFLLSQGSKRLKCGWKMSDRSSTVTVMHVLWIIDQCSMYMIKLAYLSWDRESCKFFVISELSLIISRRTAHSFVGCFDYGASAKVFTWFDFLWCTQNYGVQPANQIDLLTGEVLPLHTDLGHSNCAILVRFAAQQLYNTSSLSSLITILCPLHHKLPFYVLQQWLCSQTLVDTWSKIGEWTTIHG